MIGLDGSGLFFIDKEVEKLSPATHAVNAEPAIPRGLCLALAHL